MILTSIIKSCGPDESGQSHLCDIIFLTVCIIVILVGDTGVGKTHLLSRYIKGSLPKNKFPTIGVEFATKPVPLKTGGTVKAQIWDTGKATNTIYRN
jgi:hypothetical protein